MSRRRSASPLTLTIFATLWAVPVVAKTINVPADKPTIQGAINAAKPGDMVLVAPGTYSECIDFQGKAITVTSTYQTDLSAIEKTIIDGGGKGTVVTFGSGEKAIAALRSCGRQSVATTMSAALPSRATENGALRSEALSGKPAMRASRYSVLAIAKTPPMVGSSGGSAC